MSDDTAKLIAERDAALIDLDNTIHDYETAAAKMLAEKVSLHEKVAEMEGALAPFIALAKVYPRPRITTRPEDTVIFSHRETQITLADFDRASATASEG